MALKPMTVKFDEREMLWLARVIYDEDPQEALAFIDACLKDRFEKTLQDHCVPVFEASYKNSQKTQLSDLQYENDLSR